MTRKHKDYLLDNSNLVGLSNSFIKGLVEWACAEKSELPILTFGAVAQVVVGLAATLPTVHSPKDFENLIDADYPLLETTPSHIGLAKRSLRRALTAVRRETLCDRSVRAEGTTLGRLGAADPRWALGDYDETRGDF